MAVRSPQINALARTNSCSAAAQRTTTTPSKTLKKECGRDCTNQWQCHDRAYDRVTSKNVYFYDVQGMRQVRQKLRVKFSDRSELWLSTGRQVDALWVRVSLDSDPEPILRRVEEALRLIKTYDRIRYDRLSRDLKGVWIRLVPGALGTFNAALCACELDRRFILDDDSPPELIAAVIVHEATHARILHCGIESHEKVRSRIETICLRRELAFAARIPNGERVRDWTERTLPLTSTEEYWTDEAFEERFRNENAKVLREFGVPDWLIQFTLVLRKSRQYLVRTRKRVCCLFRRRPKRGQGAR
jgi:hypothetical protein